MIKNRVNALLQGMTTYNLDYVAIMPGSGMEYFADLAFHLMERPIAAFFSQSDLTANIIAPALVAPGFEIAKLATMDHPFAWQTFPWSDEEGPEGAFRACAEALGLSGQRIGVEELVMRVKEYTLLSEAAPGVMIGSADPLISSLRLIKDAEEINRMKAAVTLVEQVLADTLPYIKIGMTEKEIAALLTINLFQAGSGPLPFDPLVQTGETGSAPHAFPGERALAEGDLLIIDVGARVDGYVSDITRTFAVGAIREEIRHYYDLVLRANEAGRQATKPGLECQAIDRAARRVIEEGDAGQYFIHRTGHGIGLDEHEPPYIVEGDESTLQSGMTFTVEPGLYMAGLGGIRIEDNVLVTADGVETLTTFSRELQVVG